MRRYFSSSEVTLESGVSLPESAIISVNTSGRTGFFKGQSLLGAEEFGRGCMSTVTEAISSSNFSLVASLIIFPPKNLSLNQGSNIVARATY